MAEKFKVKGEQYYGITGQMLEVQRQIRLKNGSSLDPDLVILALQDIIEGKFHYEKEEKVNPEIKLIASEIKILEGIIDFEAYFTKNETVKYLMNPGFRKHLFNSTKKRVSSIHAMSFSKHQFTKAFFDNEIIKHFQISESAGLMTQEEILWTIVSLTMRQPNGEAGDLLNNGDPTIVGYIRCYDSLIRVVYLFWDSVATKWSCYCSGFYKMWFDGSEMLFRN